MSKKEEREKREKRQKDWEECDRKTNVKPVNQECQDALRAFEWRWKSSFECGDGSRKSMCGSGISPCQSRAVIVDDEVEEVGGVGCAGKEE